MKRLLAAASAAIALACANTALAATVLTFEDISMSGAEIPTHYAGLQWENVYVTSNSFLGYGTGQIGPGVQTAVTGFGGPGAMHAGGGTFDFISGYFTAGFNDGLTLKLTGLRHGVEAYSTVVTIDTTGPLFLNLNWTDITRFEFEASGGTPAGSSSQTHVVFDYLTLDLANLSAVPEPATWAMMIIGFGATGSLLRRSRRLVRTVA